MHVLFFGLAVLLLSANASDKSKYLPSSSSTSKMLLLSTMHRKTGGGDLLCKQGKKVRLYFFTLGKKWGEKGEAEARELLVLTISSANGRGGGADGAITKDCWCSLRRRSCSLATTLFFCC